MKKLLDNHITKWLMRTEDLEEEEARSQAESMSACVYSASQEDAKPSEDKKTDRLRKLLTKYYLDYKAEVDAKQNFNQREHPLRFLIVCNKLLTGFDAPIESVMYLDAPLKEHNLLQAIARTNRVYSGKQNGLIVDYIGVSGFLDKALESYRKEDIEHAMLDIDELADELKIAHKEVISMMKGIQRTKAVENLKKEFDALVQALGSEDAWLTFKRKARYFVKVYETLSPEPQVLKYQYDLKWIAGFLTYANQIFEHKEYIDMKHFSAKIREMLEEHLHVTGLTTLCKIRKLTDPDFWADFEATDPEDIKTAAIKKSTELRKILQEKMAENFHQYAKFSEMVEEAIQKFDQGLLASKEMLNHMHEISKGVNDESNAYKASGLDPRAYGIYKILEALNTDNPLTQKNLEELAEVVHEVYEDDDTAPVGWHFKEELKKSLRKQVRRIIKPAGLDWKVVPPRVEEYALKNYIKT